MSGERDRGAEVVCALCGWRFGGEGAACSGCPLARGCDVARCPRCGYRFPRSSALVDRISRWAGRLGRRMR